MNSLSPKEMSSMMCYSDSQMETQDSSFTYIYDHDHDHSGSTTFFSEFQDLEAIPGFQAFSANSGFEVDDFASIGKVQVAYNEFGTNSVESSTNELALSGNCSGNTKTLSLGVAQTSEKAIVVEDSDSSTFGQRTSIYKGVTRHRSTGRYEAHLWDNSIRREGKGRKGRQMYLGGYEKEENAARAYDLAALKYWGSTATTNFPVSNYTKELEEMKYITNQEFIASLRRKSIGFSRGASIYRGVIRGPNKKGKWQAKIGRVEGNKDLYLGTFATEKEAAEAYDIASIKFRGANAVTNFEISKYDVEAIMKSSSLPLPVGGAAKRSKQRPPPSSIQQQQPQYRNVSRSNFSAIHQPIPFNSSTVYYDHNLFHHFHPTNVVTPESATIANGLTALPAAETKSFIWLPHQSY